MLISVVINTYSRAPQLLQTLHAFQEQSLDRDEFELVIIDDGSTDDTWELVQSLRRQSKHSILAQRQPNQGPAVARNLGIEIAKGELIVFVGDDIVPARDFLAVHRKAHESGGNLPELAVAGYTKWPTNFSTTPFLSYIAEFGPQFAYGLYAGPAFVDRNLFYTSNVSVWKSFLTQLDLVFDPRFRFAAYEDVDLAYRLEKVGMRLYYEPHAIAFHHHPMDVKSFAKRQEMVGRSYHFLDQKYGERTATVAARPRFIWALGRLGWLRRLLQTGLQALDQYHVPMPTSVYGLFLALCFARGYSEIPEPDPKRVNNRNR
jgi:GT2 family glycosyltransferase